MSIIFKLPSEIAADIALAARKKRLELDLSQQTLAMRSGVSYGTVKKFERTGQISLESLLKIALVLDELRAFERLFAESEKIPASLDELLKEKKTRKRGRK